MPAAQKPRSAVRSHARVLPMEQLPPGGYTGPIPAWPILESANRDRKNREMQLWLRIWRTPAAFMWAKLGWHEDVAIYVRVFHDAERGDLKAIAESRLQGDRIGLSFLGMQRLRWQIGDQAEATVHELPATGTSGSARERAASMGVRAVATDVDLEEEDLD